MAVTCQMPAVSLAASASVCPCSPNSGRGIAHHAHRSAYAQAGASRMSQSKVCRHSHYPKGPSTRPLEGTRMLLMLGLLQTAWPVCTSACLPARVLGWSIPWLMPREWPSWSACRSRSRMSRPCTRGQCHVTCLHHPAVVDVHSVRCPVAVRRADEQWCQYTTTTCTVLVWRG